MASYVDIDGEEATIDEEEAATVEETSWQTTMKRTLQFGFGMERDEDEEVTLVVGKNSVRIIENERRDMFLERKITISCAIVTSVAIAFLIACGTKCVVTILYNPRLNR